ncbi:MAG: hypothetical protein KGH57_03080 [Candidatus Micrarchaeota archaeon]|nr:hypothetical protein [Candidatus Micrarchaeota archaeon]
MRAQSAVEFLTTYSWAFLVIGIFVVSVLAVVSLPSKNTPTYLPESCYISPSFPCSEALMATNSVGTVFLLLFQNNLGTGIYFPENVLTTYNGVVLTPSFTSNSTYGGLCFPQNAIAGSTITCSVNMPTYKIPTGSQANPRFTLSYQICAPRCTRQVYNTSGTAITVVNPYKSVVFTEQLLTNPTNGLIALDGVSYANGANVILVFGATYSLYAIPGAGKTFFSWTSSGVTLSGTSTQSITANAFANGNILATFH